MLEPGLRMLRAAHPSLHRAVDCGECRIEQLLTQLLGKSRVVAGDEEVPSAARQLDTFARRPPAHLDASRMANARLTVRLTSSGDIRRMHSRPIGHLRR